MLLVLGIMWGGMEFSGSKEGSGWSGRRLLRWPGSGSSSIRSGAKAIVRKTTTPRTFGTIFQGELQLIFKLQEGGDAYNKLITTLKQMEATGLDTVVHSLSWEYFNPDENTLRWEWVDKLLSCACGNTNLKVRTRGSC